MSIIEMSKTVTLNEASAVAETSTIGAATMDSTATTVTFKEKKGGVVIADGKTSGIKIVSRDNMITDAGGTVALTLREKTTGIHLEDNVISMTGNETEAVVITDETNLQHQEAGINKKAISTNLNLGISNELDSPQEIVFIDSSVGGYEELANGVLPGRKVVILDSSLDGFGQIVRVLEEHPQVLSIHIVSHGTPGSLFLGNSEFNLNSIDSSNTQTLELKALSVKNILLYGCYLAAGPCGREFIEKLHQLTGANIAASARLTGGKFLGGDWELEFVRGELEVVLPFTEEIQRTWGYVLAAFEDRPAVYQIKDGVIKELNPLTRKFTEVANTNNTNINAAGFNEVDKYIYGFDNSGSSHKLVRIDSNGTVEYVKKDGTFTTDNTDTDIYQLVPPTTSKILAGDVDDKQQLWVINTPDDDGVDPTVNVKLYRIYLPEPGDNTKTGEIKSDFSVLNIEDMPEDIVYVQNEESLYGISGEGEFIFNMDTSTAVLSTETGDTTEPDRSSTLRGRDSETFNDLGKINKENYEAAWSGSEGGLYISNNDQVYHVVNFPPKQTSPGKIKVENLVVNTEKQSAKQTDGISTSHLKSVFQIPLMDLNGTQDTQNIIQDVNYATTFEENDAEANIVNISKTTTVTGDVVTYGGLAIKDYINNDDSSGPPETGNVNGTGFTRDRDRLTKATIKLTDTFDGDDLVIGSLPASITSSKSGGVGNPTIVTLTPSSGTTASVEDFRDAIIAIKFQNTSENPNTTNRIIEFVLTDEDDNTSDEIFGTSGGVHTTTVTVQAVNDPPTLDLDENDSTTSGNNYTTTFTEDEGAVAIGDSDVSITDVDDSNIESATITLSSRPDGDTVESLSVSGTLPTGISASSYDSGTGVITLTGSATLADYQTAIAQIQYNNTSQNPDPTDRTVTVVVNDGNVDSNTATTTISVVVPVNDPVHFDFNADGVADILWRHKSLPNGPNRIWLMKNDGTRDSIVNPGSFGSNWNVEEVGDFNADGVDDILWRHQSLPNGPNKIWLMENDGTRDSIVNPGSFNSNWDVAGM